MTETNTQSAAVSAEGSHKESPWQGQRGVTVIPAQVVAQIAAQAAYESANVGRSRLKPLTRAQMWARMPEDYSG